MRSQFDEQLLQLNHEMIEMGALCEEIIESVTEDLVAGILENVDKIRHIGSKIDRKERSIEANCLKMLLQQQPVASDLRQISSALKMITDMERIGDQAEEIAEILLKSNSRTVPEAQTIRDMANATIKMVRHSVDSFVKQDIVLAESVIKSDDQVDHYFYAIRKHLIKMIAQTESGGEEILDLLMVTKYYERISDHATNIAEWVIFSVTGEHKKV